LYINCKPLRLIPLPGLPFLKKKKENMWRREFFVVADQGVLLASLSWHMFIRLWAHTHSVLVSKPNSSLHYFSFPSSGLQGVSRM